MRLTYDATTDVAYLVLRPVRPGERLGPTLLLENDRGFAGAVALDFSEVDGRAVGLEFQMASGCLPAELIAGAERTDGASLAARLDERVAPHIPPDVSVAGDRRSTGRPRHSH